MLSGAHNIAGIKQIQEEVVKILSSRGFKLSKWHSYHSSLLENENNVELLEQYVDDTIKALEITWSPKIDTINLNLKATKRNILSISARVFDPLGFLCLIIINVKILLQASGY